MIRLAFLAAAAAAVALTTHTGLLWLLLWTVTTAAVTTKTTSKTQVTEQRVNRLVAMITSGRGIVGAFGDSSYDVSSGADNIGSADNGGVTSGPSGTISSFPAAGPNHTHAMAHGHHYGSLATDFNALRDSYSATVAELNTLRSALRSAGLL